MPQPGKQARCHESTLRRGPLGDSSIQQKSLLSGTEATMHIPQPEDIESTVSTPTTARDIAGNGVELPPAPKNSAEKDFECPYCFVIFPPEIAASREDGGSTYFKTSGLIAVPT